MPKHEKGQPEKKPKPKPQAKQPKAAKKPVLPRDKKITNKDKGYY